MVSWVYRVLDLCPYDLIFHEYHACKKFARQSFPMQNISTPDFKNKYHGKRQVAQTALSYVKE
jgi:hypothetical protein